MTARPNSACRPVPTPPVEGRPVVSSHNCLARLVPAGTRTDRNGFMWAAYACAVDGSGYEVFLGTDVDHVRG